MAADFASKFGSTSYSSLTGVTIEKFSVPAAVKTRTAQTPGRHGGYTAGGLFDPRHIQMSGLIQGESAEGVRDNLDDFLALHVPGAPQKLYLHSDRYIYAEVAGVSNVEFDGLWGSRVMFEVDFLCCDPFWYAETASQQTGLSAGGTVTAGGNAFALPQFTLVVSSIGSGGTITIANTTTGESVILTPTQTGTYIFDSRLETITRSSVDKSGEMSGPFLTLNVGANTITVATANGAAVTSLQCDWSNRFV